MICPQSEQNGRFSICLDCLLYCDSPCSKGITVGLSSSIQYPVSTIQVCCAIPKSEKGELLVVGDLQLLGCWAADSYLLLL